MKKHPIQLRNLFWLILSALVIFVDQFTKYLAYQFFYWGESKPILPVFDLTLVANKGAAFSLLGRASGWQRWFFIGVAISISIGLVVWLVRLPRNERWTAAAISFIIGGALGNVYDRIRYGYVIDFLHLHVKSFSWPVFNIADTLIVFGVFILIFQILFKPE